MRRRIQGPFLVSMFAVVLSCSGIQAKNSAQREVGDSSSDTSSTLAANGQAGTDTDDYDDVDDTDGEPLAQKIYDRCGAISAGDWMKDGSQVVPQTQAKLDLWVYKPIIGRNDKKLANGSCVGFIEDVSSTSVTGGWDKFYVLPRGKTFVWIGRAQKPKQYNPGGGQRIAGLRGLRAVLVRLGSNGAAEQRPMGVIRAVHSLPNSAPHAVWSTGPSGNPSKVLHWNVTSEAAVPLDVVRATRTAKSDWHDFAAMVVKTGPWFTCSTYGCCKIQP